MIFGDDRTRLRRVYLEAWRKRRQGVPMEPLEVRVAEVVARHPEYHALLESEAHLEHDFGPDSGRTNPFLHMAMHLALVEQVATNRPAGIRDLHHRLAIALGSEHEAEHRMMECLGLALWEAQREGRPPDEQAYMECLKRCL